MALRNNAWRKILRTSLLLFCALLLAVGLLLLVIPSLDGFHSRRLANEASAASTLRMILMLQEEYTAAHAYMAFACELPLLRPIGQQRLTDQSFEFLTNGVKSGYKFALISCGADANRDRVRYQLVAVPVKRGETGIRAFCADETGVIWYDVDGSATGCLASHHVVE